MVNSEENVQEKSCSGCGVKLQTQDKEKAGYVPKSALAKDRIICQRCFKITHYSEVSPVELTDEDYLRILHSIGDSRALVVKIVDMFDFNGSWITGIQRFVGNNPILVVGNKVDLLPKNMNLNRMKNWLQHSVKEMGLKPLDVLFCSAEKGMLIEELLQTIDHYRKKQNVYIVGATNVGKTTLINQILKKVGVQDNELLTASRFPGTTLDLIEIPFEDGSALYDTPGIINRHQMAHYISTEELKTVSPSKPIKPKVFQLDEQQTLFFGGLSRLDFVQGDHQSFVCYVSNLVTIHRTKLEKADELYSNHLGGLLSPPGENQLSTWPKMKKHSFKIKAEPTDIVFSGLGWVTLKGSGAYVEAHAPEGVTVTVRKALI
ncbi:ribosome biogenesis GTPase YqeH [Bacillus horti]|uniref:Ribosome biogenesis GTPase YqeH n=1 Tax=Caldalkalibacillus horti TaxID=77523 RepID=A0ABT9VTD1_9BACI|nr:ribosome biogenesis GTPase YqeH [Bacillus horti]MDQ0164134.1 ribosome biogenesis GTPase YqeH [Bacillus horti]